MVVAPRLGLVTEAFPDRALPDVLDWVARSCPGISDLEIGTGGYAPTTHCDLAAMLRDASARKRWSDEIAARGLRVGALNVWGNPLHPDAAIAAKHDADLRDSIRLAALLGVERVVALAGCPAGRPGDHTPHFAGGGWLPYLEGVREKQWKEAVEPYWLRLAEFSAEQHPELLICLELHPGTVVYNVESFNRIAALGDAICANIDPSHFFWMGMDPLAVVEAVGDRIGHCHAKDLVFAARHLALNGLLDARWPGPPAEMPWNFATVGRGHDQDWWRAFVGRVAEVGRARTVAIEHEDPFVPAEHGVPEAAGILGSALNRGD